MDQAMKDMLAQKLGVKPGEPAVVPGEPAVVPGEPVVVPGDPALPEGAVDAATLFNGFKDVDLTAALEGKTPPAKPAEAKPAEAKPAEAKPADHTPGDPDPATKDGKAFAAMRKQIKELTDQLEAAKATTAKPEELQTLMTKLQEKDQEIGKLADQIGMIDLERDPRFQAKYGQEEALINTQIKELAVALEISEDVVARVMAAPLKQRVEILTEEAGASAPLLLSVLSQRDAVYQRKQADLAKHRQVREQMDQQQGTQDLALEQHARGRLFEGALATAKEQGHFVFVGDESNTDRTALANKAVSMARDLFTSNDGVRQSQAMMMGVAAPVYLEMLKLERARSVRLEGELKRRFGKVPSIGADAATPAVGAPAEIPKSMTPDQAAAALMARRNAG